MIKGKKLSKFYTDVCLSVRMMDGNDDTLGIIIVCILVIAAFHIAMSAVMPSVTPFPG